MNHYLKKVEINTSKQTTLKNPNHFDSLYLATSSANLKEKYVSFIQRT